MIGLDVKDIIQRSPVAFIDGAEEILRECMDRSIEVRYGMVDDVVACVWGLIPPTYLSTQAWLWLLTTDIIAEHKFLFIRQSQRYIAEALKRYPEIIGDTDIANESAKKWLKWLGAEFGHPYNGRVPFIIKASNE